MEIPHFKYYPNAAKNGVFQASDELCYSCDKVRGYIYKGPIYAREELLVCPWCIADGSVNRKFGATFLDSNESVGGFGKWEKVSQEIVEEIMYRTPGVDSWQWVNWFTHCKDAAAYLGPVGYKELLVYGNDAILAIKETSGVSNDDWNEYLKSFAIGESPTAYLFQCLHCGKYGGFSDCD